MYYHMLDSTLELKRKIEWICRRSIGRKNGMNSNKEEGSLYEKIEDECKSATTYLDWGGQNVH